MQYSYENKAIKQLITEIEQSMTRNVLFEQERQARKARNTFKRRIGDK